MKGKTAKLVFLTVCIVLAILLFTNTIDTVLSGSIFAASLVVLGALSRGFQR